MREELVSEDGRVGVDFDEVDGDSGDFGEHGAPEGVGEGEGGIVEDEVDGGAFCLRLLVSTCSAFSKCK